MLLTRCTVCDMQCSWRVCARGSPPAVLSSQHSTNGTTLPCAEHTGFPEYWHVHHFLFSETTLYLIFNSLAKKHLSSGSSFPSRTILSSEFSSRSSEYFEATYQSSELLSKGAESKCTNQAGSILFPSFYPRPLVLITAAIAAALLYLFQWNPSHVLSALSHIIPIPYHFQQENKNVASTRARSIR